MPASAPRVNYRREFPTEEPKVMSTKRWMGFVAISVLFVGLLAVLDSTSPGQAPATKPVEAGVLWEYAIHYSHDPDPRKGLNELGKNGWELVGFSRDGRNETMFVFKR